MKLGRVEITPQIHHTRIGAPGNLEKLKRNSRCSKNSCSSFCSEQASRRWQPAAPGHARLLHFRLPCPRKPRRAARRSRPPPPLLFTNIPRSSLFNFLPLPKTMERCIKGLCGASDSSHQQKQKSSTHTLPAELCVCVCVEPSRGLLPACLPPHRHADANDGSDTEPSCTYMHIHASCERAETLFKGSEHTRE